jgi:hypothetical protein
MAMNIWYWKSIIRIQYSGNYFLLLSRVECSPKKSICPFRGNCHILWAWMDWYVISSKSLWMLAAQTVCWITILQCISNWPVICSTASHMALLIWFCIIIYPLQTLTISGVFHSHGQILLHYLWNVDVYLFHLGINYF